MALAGSTIAGKVKLLLQDETSIRWTETELIGWINAAKNEIILHKPNACITTRQHSLAAGSKQTLSASDIQLIDVVRMTGGSAVTLVNRNVLDVTIPTWHSTTGTAKHYCFDPRNPTVFYLYPGPATATGTIDIVVATIPTDIASLGDSTGLDAVYEAPVTDYVMYRAFSKDSEHTANTQRAQQHYQAFINSIQGKLQGEVVFAPQAMFGNLPSDMHTAQAKAAKQG